MSSPIPVTEARMVRAAEHEVRSGLLAYLTITLADGILLDGLTLRRSEEGALYVGFPSRTDRHGKRHAIVRPLSEDARLAFERQVFQALRAGGGR